MVAQKLHYLRPAGGFEGLRHVAIIPDGNRRWAKERGLPAEDGHRRGFMEVSPAVLEAAWTHGLHTATLWLFSTENWRRSEGEVRHLISIYEDFLLHMLGVARRLGVRMIHLGRKDRLPPGLSAVVRRVERETLAFDQHVFNFGLDYGGSDEVTRAVRRLIADGVPADSIDEALVGRYLDTGVQPHPNPDLTIRTAGDLRLSGLMPWQCQYSELYFLDRYYPDFSWEALVEAVDEFGGRQRRFGG